MNAYWMLSHPAAGYTFFTMILLVVPLGFSTGTELLKTSAHNSQTDFPMVNFDPPDSERTRETECDEEIQYSGEAASEV